MRKTVAVFMIVSAILCLPGIGRAAPFNLGDVFAGNGSQILHFDNAGNLLEVLAAPAGETFNTGMAFDGAGNLYGTNFVLSTVSQYAIPHPHNRIDSFATADSSSSAESIVFNAAGDFYVGQADGTRDILKFAAAGGAPIDRFDVATETRGSDWIDLAADQQTIYYTSEGSSVLRFDVSTNTQLADFATGLPGSNAFALRLLDDGGALVADSQTIVRLDNTGSIVQQYDDGTNNGWFALNLDRDGTTFWSADISNGNIARFDIATGAVVDSFNSGVGPIFGLAVLGEITQGGPPTDVIPAPGAILLGVLGTGLVGWLRRRKSL